MATKAANRCKRLGLAPATTAALLASTALVSAQSALPTGGQVAAGSATISASGPAMTVNQGWQRAIVNWQGFSVGQPNSVTFVQPSTSSAILNRVAGSAFSTIAGQITGNGQVFLVNPNGIAITSTGTVKVGGGFVASTLGIEDRDFMAGRLTFSGGSAPAAVSNDGTITAGSGGFVGLLGGVVSNGGTINVPLGRVGLGAATQATLDPTGDGFLQVAVPSDATAADGKPLIDVSGKLSARGGLVEIKAATAQGAVRDAINVSGRVSARSVSGRNGSVVLGGGEGGSVQVTGRVSASGRDGAGKVSLSGRVVEVAKGAAVTAMSRQGQGGSVSLKGDIVNNSGSVDVSGASGGAIDIAGISIGSYGAWNLQGASGAGGVFTARGSQGYVETTSGLVLASGATAGGSIAIDAPNLFSSGRHDASSAAGRGGKVTLTGERLALVAASIDASGATGGGSVRIGGDYQGGGTLAHAATTTISPATTIRADATQAGNGGSVVVWSDAKTDFYGTISARGGQAGGHGGLVEVSSKGDLVFGGSAAVNAPLGTSGTVLLDPKNIVIDDATGKYPQYQLIDPLQGAGNHQFGYYVAQLQGTGKTVVTAHGSAIGGQSNAGAVYLYDTVTGALISTLTGSAVNDLVGNGGITTLSSGNYVVRSINWSSNRGAATWGSGATGVSGAVSSSNSLVGSAASDNVGGNGITVLSNGNYLVASGNWSGTLGALTWASGATGIAGTISSSNSLVGSVAGDAVGSYDITALGSGNYVVRTDNWSGGKGAVTWVSGAAGVSGAISSSNSLVGSVTNDQVGTGPNGITALTNGHYVVRSSNWNGTVGAVTWGNGTTGATVGAVTASNSLVGTTAGSASTGDDVGSSGVTALSNGNYVVASSIWNGGRGAATWGNGATGATVGTISSSNSLVGTNTTDRVGSSGATALSNGHYVVRSALWGNGVLTSLGAVTWGNGATGATVGAVSASNSLVGATTNDHVGSAGFTALSNGNYVVRSSNWNGNRGAVTWGNGATGATVGAVSSSNSLVGTSTTDRVGIGSLAVTELANGNYVVSSTNWSSNKGAVTWGSGTAGVSGEISSSNSLLASTNGSALAFRTAGDTNDVFIASSAYDSTSGRVFVGLGDLNALTFGRVMAQDVTIHSDAITRQLNAGSALTLQASNDITVNSAITANNPAGNGGHLTLQAGRSILVNAAITTDNGNLTLIGNDRLANGVVDAQRDAGTAVVTLAAAINAGSGTVAIELRDGAGKTNKAAGGITLGAVAAGKVSAVNSSASDGLTLNGTVTASGTGDAVVLASNGAFTNAAGAGALSLTGGGRWLIYSSDPAAASFGNLDSGNRAVWNAAYATLAPGSVAQTGNRYLFAYQPTLTYSSTDLTKAYGDDATGDLATAYTVSGLNAGLANAYLGDTLGSVVSGSASLTSTGASAVADVAGSPHAISITQGSLSASTGYAFAFNSAGLLTVTPRAVTVTASSGQGKTYGNVDPTLTYAVTTGNLVGADTLSGSLGRAAGETVGNYAINQGTLANPNYTVSFVGASFGITPRAVTVSASSGQGKDYGDADPTLTYGITAGSLAFADSFSGSLSRTAGENVGNYAIGQGSLALNANYALSYAGSDFGITPRAVTVSASSGQGKTYGNVDPTLTYSVTAGNLVGGDSFTGTLSRAAGENVGNYAIGQGTLSLGSNYTVSYVGSSFGITPRAVTVSATGGQGKTYGDVDPTLSYAVTAGSLAFADSFSGSLSRTAGGNVGNYAIGQGSLSLGLNYTLSYAGSSFGITPRAVTVSATGGQGKTYGDADTILTYTVTAGSLAFADSFSGALSRAAGENVGNYAIGQGSLSLGSNYTVTYAGSNFGITPRAVTVSATGGQGKTYGNVDPILTYTVTAGGLAFADGFSGSLGRAAGENAGNYAIGQGTLALSSNYALSYAGSTFGITPRAVTVSATSGQGKMYGDVDPTLTYVITAGSLAFADGFSGALSRAVGENVGNYAIGQGSLSLGSNYTVTYAGSNFGITPRAVTVLATGGQGKTYGNADPTLSYAVTAGNLVGGDSFTGSLSRTAGENVGNYAIGQGTLTLGSNYTLSYAGSDFAIAPRAVTVSATSGQGKTYGDIDAALTYSLTAGSLVGADAFAGSLSRAADENVGNYAIGQGTLTLGSNYTLSYAGSNFAITPRAVTISATAGQGKIHGDVDPVLAYSLTAGSLVAGDAFTGALGRAAGEDVGNYAIGRGSLALGSNYTLSYVGSIFGITPRPAAENPELPPPVLPSSRTNIWSMIARQPAWLGDQAGEAPGAGTGYVETSAPEGFRVCHPAKITMELSNSGRVQLSGSDTACAQ